MEQPELILVVDDDEVFRNRLLGSFDRRGYQTAGAACAEEAILQGQRLQPDCAVVDLRLAERSGLEVIKALKEVSPATRIVMLTGYGSIATALEAVRLGACNYLTKPADADQILAAFQTGDSAEESQSASPGHSTPSLARAQWEHIQRVLSDCGGNITRAAEQLGIPRRSLQRKLGKYPPRS